MHITASVVTAATQGWTRKHPQLSGRILVPSMTGINCNYNNNKGDVYLSIYFDHLRLN